jgi:GNAT superfamily N-acetyltransferase
MALRERVEADIDSCALLARRTHEVDRYPMHIPDDLRLFIAAPDALAAWVVEQDGDIVGHVALRPRAGPTATALATETLGLDPDRLGVVSRLLVSPQHRRMGIGRSLLDVACEEAWARGLRPVLDVVTFQDAAIRLYESCGWVRAGQVTSRFGKGPEVEEFVYLGPRPSV